MFIFITPPHTFPINNPTSPLLQKKPQKPRNKSNTRAHTLILAMTPIKVRINMIPLIQNEVPPRPVPMKVAERDLVNARSLNVQIVEG